MSVASNSFYRSATYATAASTLDPFIYHDPTTMFDREVEEPWLYDFKLMHHPYNSAPFLDSRGSLRGIRIPPHFKPHGHPQHHRRHYHDHHFSS